MTEPTRRHAARLVLAGVVFVAVAVAAAILLPVAGGCPGAEAGAVCRIEPWATVLPVVIPLAAAAGAALLLLGSLRAVGPR